MNCNEARQHWMLYLDSEGDAQLHLHLRAHLDGCADCAEWFSRQQRFEQALAERLAAAAPPPAVWDGLLRRAGVTQPVRAGRHRLVFAAGLAAALLVLGLVVLPALRRPPTADLPRLTRECHERHLRGQSAVELRSEDGPAVERYVRGQVSFPVHDLPRREVGFTVEGGGVCRWAPKPMVYVVGRVDQTAVSLFVLARDGLEVFPLDRDRLARGGGRYSCQEGGYQVVSGLTDDNIVVVVGTAPRESLEKLLNAYCKSSGG